MEKFLLYIVAFIICVVGGVGGNILGRAVGRVLREHARAQLGVAIEKTIRF